VVPEHEQYSVRAQVVEVRTATDLVDVIMHAFPIG
jgi:hypothetical protein